jgi:hypothetical protein
MRSSGRARRPSGCLARPARLRARRRGSRGIVASETQLSVDVFWVRTCSLLAAGDLRNQSRRPAGAAARRCYACWHLETVSRGPHGLAARGEGSVPGEKVPSNTWLMSMIAGGRVEESKRGVSGVEQVKVPWGRVAEGQLVKGESEKLRWARCRNLKRNGS